MSDLTHFDDDGNAHMVDISEKPQSFRVAKAACSVEMSKETLKVISMSRAKKGDVLNVARIAGIQGAKRTSVASSPPWLRKGTILISSNKLELRSKSSAASSPKRSSYRGKLV